MCGGEKRRVMWRRYMYRMKIALPGLTFISSLKHKLHVLLPYSWITPINILASLIVVISLINFPQQGSEHCDTIVQKKLCFQVDYDTLLVDFLFANCHQNVAPWLMVRIVHLNVDIVWEENVIHRMESAWKAVIVDTTDHTAEKVDFCKKSL